MNTTFKIKGIEPKQYFFGASAMLGLVFASITETEYELFFASNFLKWQLQTLVPVAILLSSHIFITKFVYVSRLNPWLQLIISGVLGAVVFTPIALLIDIMWSLEWRIGFEITILISLVNEFLGMMPPLVLAWIIINAPWVLASSDTFQMPDDTLSQKEIASQQNGELRASFKKPEFFKLLPADIGDNLLYMKAELHYLLVVTEQGKALILYNLKDAIREMKHVSGFQSHRSYWVAQSAIVSIIKGSREGKWTLKNQAQIPISRSFIKQAKEFALKHNIPATRMR